MILCSSAQRDHAMKIPPLRNITLHALVFDILPPVSFVVVLAIIAIVLFINVRSSSGRAALLPVKRGDLQKRLEDLMQEQAQAKVSGRDTTSIDAEIKAVRSKIEILDQRDESDRKLKAYMLELEQKADEQRRLEEERRKEEKEAATLQNRCEAVKEKRLSDLTVNDVELLRRCGVELHSIPIPHD